MSVETGFILFLILLLSQIFYQMKCIKDLIIPTEKRNVDIIFVIIGITVILGIVYFMGNEWTHYLLGILASVMIGLNLYKSGITSKGFSFPAGYTGGLVSHAPWDKIKNVDISQKDYVMVSFYSMSTFSISDKNILYFKKQDYEKIVNILEKNLSLDVIKIK